jgi:hypothetical protein
VIVWDTVTGNEIRRFEAGQIWHFAFSPDGKTLATGGTDGTVLLWDATRLKPDTTVPAADGDTLWADLTADAPKAYQAIVALGRLGERGVELLRARLKPATPIDPKRVAQLLADLESPQFAARDKAANELASCHDRIAKALDDRLKVTTSAEARRRIQNLQERFEGFLPLPELRDVRAVESLARNGTPAAKQFLTELAEGAPDSLLTREARTAIKP